MVPCLQLACLEGRGSAAQTKPAPESAGEKLCEMLTLQELAFRTVTARRFCDQQEMSLQTATGRSLP